MSDIAFYFVGGYGQVGHEDKKAGSNFKSGYPVFSTYNKSNKDERHNIARFVHKEDAINFSKIKNDQLKD